MSFFVLSICRVFVIGLCFCACGRSTGNPYADKIIDWQEREAACSDVPGPKFAGDLPSFLGAISRHLAVLRFGYVFDDVDYWKSSCEAYADGYGDCEDAAALAWRLVRQEGVECNLAVVLLPPAGLVHTMVEAGEWLLDPMGGPVSTAWYLANGYRIVCRYGF